MLCVAFLCLATVGSAITPDLVDRFAYGPIRSKDRAFADGYRAVYSRPAALVLWDGERFQFAGFFPDGLGPEDERRNCLQSHHRWRPQGRDWGLWSQCTATYGSNLDIYEGNSWVFPSEENVLEIREQLIDAIWSRYRGVLPESYYARFRAKGGALTVMNWPGVAHDVAVCSLWFGALWHCGRAALAVGRLRTVRRRAARSLCTTCGYELATVRHDRCPECGAIAFEARSSAGESPDGREIEHEPGKCK